MPNTSNTISIATIKLEKVLSSSILKNIIALLPKPFSSNIKKYQNPIQQSLSALGYALLNNLAISHNLSLSKLKYTQHGRPYLEGYDGDFNISRSNQVAVCALCPYGKIGIDIEFIKDIDLCLYKNQFSKLELRDIYSNSKPMLQFYKFWTRKEAIAKLDGRGLGLEFSKIPIINNPAMLDKKQIYFKEINIEKNYITTIASEKKISLSIVKFSSIPECILTY